MASFARVQNVVRDRIVPDVSGSRVPSLRSVVGNGSGLRGIGEMPAYYLS